MGLIYQCTGLSDMKPSRWTGEIRLLRSADPYEMEVAARGSRFHILFGKHQYGNYICIPNWGIGTELSGLSDSFWNLGRLSNTYPELSLVDAVSIVDALAAIEEYIEF